MELQKIAGTPLPPTVAPQASNGVYHRECIVEGRCEVWQHHGFAGDE